MATQAIVEAGGALCYGYSFSKDGDFVKMTVED